MDWSFSHLPPDLALTGWGLVGFLLAGAVWLVMEHGPVAVGRARWVLREFGLLMLALLQDLIAIADSHFPDSERRSGRR